MVNIKSVSDGEKNKNDRRKTLISLASEITGMPIFPIGDLISFKNDDLGDVEIMASLLCKDSMELTVFSPDYFNIAMQFAEIYERRTKEKVTLKKKYD